ncbi:NADP-dependent oxidoreductase [Bacillus nitratireducens]|uniref:NADP-dependent oxidoreductase n=1 Tax=Bacillus nitratireducens TaxID=2026193 RepID=UPI000895305B|nr:NADP-dependent oxidoreductase [Bacillus nitratireducens]PEB79237.1 NADPH:quinone reductase [Bacillus cereus]PFH81160.1 NADPH:quinone reductase [Bacillus cereus]SEA69349.1 NADPH:quinone reductase [Bacillus nitratireducens]
MKAIVIDQYGNVEELQERQVPKPVVKCNEVLIRIQATSVNPVDWKIRKGDLQEKLRFSFPITLGLDVAGVIEEVGEDVDHFKIGDKVFTKPENIGKGSYAEYITVKSDLVAQMPNNISFEEAASIPLAGLTAWQSLVDYAQIKENDRVLIHAGAGGVGSFAIQIAKSFGAFVATTASSKNEEFLKSLGADLIIDYKNEKFEELLSDYNIVLDTIGGEVQEKSFQIIKSGGVLVSIVHEPLHEVKGIRSGFLWLKPSGKQLEELTSLIQDGKIKPIISKVVPFSEQGVRESHILSESQHTRGKIVITME